jgi:hypothetical protein
LGEFLEIGFELGLCWAVFLPSSHGGWLYFGLVYGYNSEALSGGSPSVKDHTQQLIPNRLRKL